MDQNWGVAAVRQVRSAPLSVGQPGRCRWTDTGTGQREKTEAEKDFLQQRDSADGTGNFPGGRRGYGSDEDGADPQESRQDGSDPDREVITAAAGECHPSAACSAGWAVNLTQERAEEKRGRREGDTERRRDRSGKDTARPVRQDRYICCRKETVQHVRFVRPTCPVCSPGTVPGNRSGKKAGKKYGREESPSAEGKTGQRGSYGQRTVRNMERLRGDSPEASLPFR